MGYRLDSENADNLLNLLKKDYKVFAPKRFENRGWKHGTDLIKYAEVNSFSEIVYDEKSDFSPKEIFYPIVQTLLYFTEETCVESNVKDDKEIIVFARPCDINGIRRLDTIFLKNGSKEDNYYKRLREKIKIFMIECRKDMGNCFCVSMGSNITEDYDVSVRFSENDFLFEVKEEKFEKYFTDAEKENFIPEFVMENKLKVNIPVIENIDVLKTVYSLPFWADYNDNCISCGACNTVCITCSCFDTVDIIYNETSRDGERRRLWSSCMGEEYSTMAGGHNVRKTPGERMRFKTLHKVYDYKNRFDGIENMCVGCGRCNKRCPKDIIFSDTINTLTNELEKFKSEVVK